VPSRSFEKECGELEKNRVLGTSTETLGKARPGSQERLQLGKGRQFRGKERDPSSARYRRLKGGLWGGGKKTREEGEGAHPSAPVPLEKRVWRDSKLKVDENEIVSKREGKEAHLRRTLSRSLRQGLSPSEMPPLYKRSILLKGKKGRGDGKGADNAAEAV